MATVFWDAKGVILLDILPQGQCINAARYCSTLDLFKEAIRRKRPGLLRRGVVLQHDNATPHSANLTQQWLQRYVFEGGPVANLVEQFATKSEVRGSNPSPGEVNFSLLLCPSSTKWVTRGLVKTARKAMAKCQSTMPRKIRTLLLVPRCLDQAWDQLFEERWQMSA
ncbi:histone-lysine N-methyltransferase SETMAR [Plakobranchus ocellatus]|uniref:Histone-lysine N-methyltransferase SETMAR n=1 Tax=Plakobranchus ocellatus TaxID=259542 RepID=A0AAV3Z5E6_9GAST|nr:histone-lysine N-methyltransferase SETMAR [Plakobranchus ocellatus]